MATSARVGNGKPEMAADRRAATQLTTGKGVVLQLARVNTLIIEEQTRKLAVPKPPKVYLKEKEREEENPNDPEYLAAVNDYNRALGDLAVDYYIMLGSTALVVPSEVPAVDSDWPEWFEQVGIDMSWVAAAGPRRYLAWVKYVACSDHNEYLAIPQRVQVMSGLVAEVDAATAEGTFRSDPPRDADSGVPTPPEV